METRSLAIAKELFNDSLSIRGGGGTHATQPVLGCGFIFRSRLPTRLQSGLEAGPHVALLVLTLHCVSRA